jgi:type I restriction enzyme S subunit
MARKGWKIAAVDELKAAASGAIAIGPFGSRMKSDCYVDSGVPVIRGNNIGNAKGFIGKMVCITPEFADGLGNAIVHADDLVFPHRGAIGRVGIVPRNGTDRYALSSSMMKLTCDRAQVEPLYLFYFFRSVEGRHELLKNASTVGTPGIGQPLSSLRSIKVPLPPLEDQKAVAQILGTLDDKIELNRRMNGTLEAMARALFQSWFVDFDPVRAKLDGRKPVGIDAATAALFPAALQESPIGPVPKGWKVDRFDAHITADRGLSYHGEGLRDDRTGLPMHNLNSVYEGGGYKHEGLKYYAGPYREKHLLEPGDMIVTNTEQGFDHLLIGHAAIVPRCYGPKGLFSHHIYRVRHKPPSPFSPHYLVELFNSRRWHYWISGFSNGTTINMLPKDALEMPMLVVPSVELVEKFTELAEAAHIQVENNKQQSDILATLRDTLLPKLLNGSLKLSGSERILEIDQP